MSLICLLIVFADNGTFLTSLTSFGPSIDQWFLFYWHVGFIKLLPIVCGFFDVQFNTYRHDN